MAHLACPCGNSLSNSCDGDETEYYFVENGVIEAHQDDFAFFELEYNDLSTEIWKCDVCDRMMFFDGPSARVSRYMRRIDAESLGKDELAREHKSGICFNNLLFNEVDWFFRRRQSRQPPASSSARASSFSIPVGLPRGSPDRSGYQRRGHPGLHRRHRNRVRRGRLRGRQGQARRP